MNLGLSMEGLKQYQESERTRVPIGREPGRHEDRYDYMNDTRPNFEDRYDKMNDLEGYKASREGADTSFIEQLKTAIMNFFSTKGNEFPTRQGPRPEGFGTSGGRDMSNISPVVNARLDFRVENSTQLLVDGRVLASVVSPYLASDLVRLEASQGTITKRYVI